MLFDLRRRGRRRTVKIIYTGLAVLIGVGLVGFGIGTGVNGGGVVNAVSENNKGGGTPTYQKQVAEAAKRTRENPNDAAAWAALTEAQLHEASVCALLRPEHRALHAPGQGTAAEGLQLVEPVPATRADQPELRPGSRRCCPSWAKKA